MDGEPVPLRLRIKTLEERNRELAELLERAYGVIALPLNDTRVL
jgi:hypothetical protein